MPDNHANAPVRAALGLVVAGVLAGCTPELPDPVVNGVHPAWGFNGEETPVEIQGQAFYPRVQASGVDRVELDHDFRVVLGTSPETELTDVQLVDYRHLEAVVPAGLDVGTYDLRVEGPTGATGVLAGAFEVRDTRADQLRVTPANGQLSWRVLEYASLTIELVDPDGERVAEDVEVTVTAEGSSLEGLLFQSDTLEDQQALAEGIGISGRLGPDGSGTVALTSTQVAEAVLLRIAASDADSGIEGTLQILSFTPGDVAGVEIELPSAVFDTTAGTPFDVRFSVVDLAGNVVEGADTLLIVRELCSGGTLDETLSFVGEVDQVSLSVTRATVDGCDHNAIVASGIAAGAFVAGQSNLFDVAPGEAAGLAVEVWPDEVVAGEDEVLAAITAVDSYENRAVATEGPVELEASADGGPFEALAWSACFDLSEGEGYCRAVPAQAGTDVVLLATTAGPEGLVGVSAPFRVLAGAAAALELSVAEDPVVAGQPVAVGVQAVDSLGNGVALDPLGADEVAFSDGDGAVDCEWDHTDTDGTTEVYACTFTVAAEGVVLEAELPSRGVTGTSEPFDVVNGALAAVELSLSTDRITAGETLEVDLAGTDAYGNPYLVQDDPDVDLADSTGSLSPVTAHLDADGLASVEVSVTVAADADRITAAQGGITLGTSARFEVLAGDVADLALVLPATWTWLDEGMLVVVQAVDVYGNVSDRHSGPVTLSSAEGWGDDVVIAALDEGQETVGFSWDRAGLEDALVADDGHFSASADVDVLDPDCADPPAAALTVDGASPAVLCRLPGTSATRSVSVSAAGSAAGGAALARYHLLDDTGSWEASTTPTWSRSWAEIGGRRLTVVVADTGACADSAEVEVYVGDPDGSPVGPVDVVLASDSLLAGDGSGEGETTAAVAATDCGGDPAADGVLLVRADLGAIGDSGGLVVASGKGLELTLDSAGEAELTWTVEAEPYGGTGTLMVGLEGAVAYGQAQATVINDAVRPAVAEAWPAGSTAESFDTLELRFTEPLFEDTLGTDTVVLSDPDGVAVAIEAADIVLDGSELIVGLPELLDASRGIWTLQLGSSIRDLDGNRLDGTWTGTRSDFTLEFGAVADDAPDLDGCSAAADTLRPDGDDGSGDEGEEVLLTVSAEAAPAWWRLVVQDDQGQAVRTLWTPGSGATSTELAWDAHGDDGLIVSNGSYKLEVAAGDLSWNLGAGCSATVVVDNRLVAP